MSVSVVTSWKCTPCSKNFKTIEQLNEHKNSKKHKKFEKEYRIAHPDIAQSSLFKSVQHESSQGDFLADLQRSISGAETPSIEEEDLGPHIRTTLESLRICLFCN
jgi:transcriptional regulator NrdR family protein